MSGNVAGKIVEITNGNEFQSEVLNSKVPVIVDFWASWCGPCNRLAPIFESVANRHSAEEFKFVKVNVEEFEDIAQRYEVRGIPMMIVFKSGEVADTQVGLVDEDALNLFVEQNK